MKISVLLVVVALFAASSFAGPKAQKLKPGFTVVKKGKVKVINLSARGKKH
jgi:hypothetical protein